MDKIIVLLTCWISVPFLLPTTVAAWSFSVICSPHHHSLLFSSTCSVESRHFFPTSNSRPNSFHFSAPVTSAVLFSTSEEEAQNVEKNSDGLLDNANVFVKEDSTTNQRMLIQELDQKFSYQGRMRPQHGDNRQQQQQQRRQDDGRFGYIGLVGAPNMGKSTLLNALIGEELCVASRRPQTTRHAILGILTEQNVQLAFLDTPGVIKNPSYLLQEGMMEAVKGALNDADVILLVTDVFSTPLPDDDLFAKIQLLSSSGAKPVIVAVNKVDMLAKVIEKRKLWEQKQKLEVEESPRIGGLPISSMSNGEQEDDEDTLDYAVTSDTKTYSVEDAVLRWRMLLPNALAIIPLIATDTNHAGVRCLRTLLCAISDVPESIRNLGRPIPGMFREGVKFISNQEARSLLPVGPPLYEEDALTDRSERFFASEMIRAAIFEEFQKEIPYCTEVQVTEFKESKQQQQQQQKNDGENNNNSMLRLSAIIFVERESQMGILVGTGGKQIKKVGIRARKSLESFFQSKVHLDLRVKVDKDWRSKEDKLKKFGYIKK